MSYPLLSVDMVRSTGRKFQVCNLMGTSAKVVKSLRKEVITPVMYLTPHLGAKHRLSPRDGSEPHWRDIMILNAVSKKFDMHPDTLMATATRHNSCAFACTCSKVCLATYSGNLALPDQQEYEFAKTLLYLANPGWFTDRLNVEIAKFENRAHNGFTYEGRHYDNARVHVRLNGGSDIDWTKANGIIRRRPDTQFYDYTKDPFLANEYTLDMLPPNYHLTFSAGTNDRATYAAISRGMNVAVVLKDFPDDLGSLRHLFPDVVSILDEYTLIDGTKHDARVLDPDRSIVCLKPIGHKAKKVDIDKQKFIFSDIEEFANRMHAEKVKRAMESSNV